MLELAKIVPGTIEFAHLTDRFERGELDSVWVPLIAQQGRWIVITADNAKKNNKGGKLPRLCSEFKVTHVLLSGALHQKTTAEKRDAILLMWGRIAKLDGETPGTRFKLKYKSKKGSKDEVVLVLEKSKTT
jgi:hypothetical protein